MIRKITSIILSTCILSGIFYNVAYASNSGENATDEASLISLLSDKISEKNMSENLIDNVKSELYKLSELGLDINSLSINDINEDEDVQYSMQYNNEINEYFTIDEDSQGNLTMDITAEGKHDVLQINSDGKLLLDGKEIIFSHEEYQEIGKNINQTTNEITPYANARDFRETYPKILLGKSIDYNEYIATIVDNDITFEKAIVNCSITLISVVLTYGLTLSLGVTAVIGIGTALSPDILWNAQVSNPSSAYISYRLTKWKYKYDYKYPGSKHYEYSGKYYVDKKLKGTYTPYKFYESITTLYY